jgi:xanthine dehydrogenase iron-sulfur cluster and FAD-binding subunit A
LQAATHLASRPTRALFETHQRLDKALFDSQPDHSAPYKTGFRAPQTLNDLKDLLRQQPSANLIAGGNGPNARGHPEAGSLRSID